MMAARLLLPLALAAGLSVDTRAQPVAAPVAIARAGPPAAAPSDRALAPVAPARTAAAPAPVAVPTLSRVVTLRAGDAVVFRLAEGSGAPVLLRQGPAAREGKLARGELRAALADMADGQALLTLENANPFFVAYQAVMTMPDGSSVPTAVCALLPDARTSYEHWPHPVSMLTLFGFARADENSAACG